MLRCMIVDDEPLAQEVLVNYALRIGELEVVKKCSSAVEAFQWLHKEKVDLIFLDIQMPQIDGLSFLKSLSNPPAIILTTAFPKYAVEGYDLDVADYLLKPVSFERFMKSVNKVIQKRKQPEQGELKSRNEYIFLKVDARLVKVNYTDIIYIEGMKDYLKIFTGPRPLVVHQTMKKIEESLPGDQFIRIHKSYIVSLRSVISISGNMVSIGEKEIPIGAIYKEQLIKTVFKLNN